MPDSIREAKAAINEAIQSTTEGAGLLDGAIVTRWVLVAEFAMPDGTNSLMQLSNRMDGSDLHAWDRKGMLFHSLMEGTPGRRRRVLEDPE